MRKLRALLLALVGGAALFAGSTAQAATIGGTISEDLNGDGGLGDGVAAPGVNLRVYADVNNNGVVDAGDTFLSTTTTNVAGAYSFTVNTAVNGNNYLVSVDSRSVAPSAGFNVTFVQGDVWAEQTYGDNPSTAALDLGVRFGGRNGATSDGYNTAATAPGSNTYEHLARVSVSAGNVAGVNFGFSFDAVTNVSGDDAADDDAGANRTVQGSFRQFIQNANAVAGANVMRFTPAVATNASGGGGNWWRLSVTVAWPPSTDDSTTFDGRAYSSTNGTTVRDDNPGSLGTGGTVGVDAVALGQVARPELEISDGAALNLNIDLQGANSTVRRFALNGFGNNGSSDTHAEIKISGVAGALIEDNIFGTSASTFTDPGAAARTNATAIRSSNADNATVRNNLFGFIEGKGIAIRAGSSGWTVTGNEFRSVGLNGAIFDGIDVETTSGTAAISANLFINGEGNGVDMYNGNGANTLVNNTFSGNGQSALANPETANIRVYGTGNTIDRNIITAAVDAGMLITSGATNTTITRNSIFNNGAIGIDLLTAADNAEAGTAPYLTINDSGDGDTGGNGLLNFPILTSASVSSGNLVISGFAQPGAVIELFIADSDPTNFGQGQTYVTTLTEGSGADTDAGTGTYTNPVNGLNQGTDTTNRFTFTIATPGGVGAGTRLTATGRVGTATSEFSGVATVSQMISGTVFEDVAYAGGVGRSQAASSGVARPGARVELYTAAGAFSTFTTTDASGNYSFSVAPSTSYTVRVVNSSVTSSLGGAGLVPVQTYRTMATTSSAVGVTDRVGGEDPGKADAGNGATTLAALTAGALTPQSITSVATGTGGVTGVDFGYNFNTVVNNNDTAQGSLRQLITNANGLTGAQTSVFMITDGAAHAGLRAGLTSDLTGGVAVITLLTVLPQVTDTLTLDATTQTTNIGNTNAGTLGTGGTVGVDAVAFGTVSRPEVEIVFTGGIAGLNVAAASSTIQGFAMHGGNSYDIQVTGVTGVTISGNVLGTTATSFTLPGANPSDDDLIKTSGTTSGCTVSGNLLGFAGTNGLQLIPAATGWSVSQNEVRGCARISTAGSGINLRGTNHAFFQNLLAANKCAGVDNWGGASSTLTFLNNTITGNGVGTGATRIVAGLRLVSDNNTIDRNIVSLNYGAGVLIASGSVGNTITRNSIFSNGTITNDGAASASAQVGIDLQNATDDAALGTSPFYTINDSGDGDSGGNGLLNFPVITAANISAGNLVLTGFAPPGAAIELFIADSDPSNFGEGQTYVTTLTEGSGADTDAGTGTYTNPVNGLNQGTDTTNRFTFSIPTPGGVVNGTRLTATGTVASATSEFSGVATVFAVEFISGIVSEDVNGDGGLGDGVVRPGVSLRLYADVNNNGLVDAGDTFHSVVTTDAAGAYSFSVSSPTDGTNFLVAVDSRSIAPSGGLNGGFTQGDVWAEQTYGDNPATAGLDLGVRFGGRTGNVSDGYNPASTAVASNTYEHLARVSVSAGDVAGVNFGFSFNAVTNLSGAGAVDDDAAANRTVQGSLRQFIQNANAVTGANGLRFTPAVATNASGGGGNWWTLSVTTTLPTSTDASTTFDGRAYSSTDGTTVRDDNPGSLGAGGTVGVDAVALGQVARPEFEITDGASLDIGLNLQGANHIVRRLAISGFGDIAHDDVHADIRLSAAAGGTLIEQNIIGTSPASFTDPGAAARSGGTPVRSVNADNVTLQNNLIGFSAGKGIAIRSGSSGWTVTGNEVRGTGIGSFAWDGIDIEASGTASVVGNLIIGAQAFGVDMFNSTGGNIVQNNTFSGNGQSAGPTAETGNVRVYGASNVIDRNIITAAQGAGIVVTSGATTSTLTRNSIFNNGGIGIDLLTAADNQEKGTAPFITPNDSGDADAGANGLLNFPVITAAYLSGANLVITGFARPGATIELFIADNDATNFGEGQTYLTTLTEGSGADTDASTGTYTDPVNGLNQGTDTTNRFTFIIPTPGGVAVGTRLTSTATVSNSTSEFSGVATVFSGLTISGTVYGDTNRNSRKETTETGTGLTLYVKVIDPALPPASPALAVATVTPATGDYTITGVNTGLYTLILDDNATLADVTPTLPAGWMALEGSGGRRPNVAVAATSVSAQDFGLSQGMPITGKIFVDTGTGGGTANNGVQDGTEAGLAGVVVKLTDSTGATIYSTATTGGDGAFGLAYPTTLTTGTQLKIVEQNATGYVSTGAGVGDTAGTYVRGTDTITFTLTANASYTGVAFGDVPATALLTDGAQTALPGATIHYPHTFTAGTAGTVTFSVAIAPTPATPGWSPTLYRDTNANGLFDAGEPQITAAIPVTAGQVVAVLVKEFVPLNIAFGAQNQTTLTASFVYANAPAITATLNRRDITTVGEPQNGALLLTKAVDKTTALPGQTLTYTITYTNRGPAPLNTLVIYDTTPAFSTFTSAANGPLPASLTGVALTAPSVGAAGAIRWNFTGPLAPGSTGTVSFTVTIDQ